MKSLQNLLAALGRKVTLNIADHKNQQAKQDNNLNYVIKKKLKAGDKRVGNIEAQRRQEASKQSVQPFHAEYLVLKEVPDQF